VTEQHSTAHSLWRTFPQEFIDN